MTREQTIRTIRKILKNAGIKKAYLFGSFARNRKRYRDIDIAIDYPRGFSLLDLSHLENVLEEKTNKKIDLGTIKSINPLLKEHIEKDLVAIL